MHPHYVAEDDPPAITSPLLGVEVCTTTHHLCNVGNQTQCFVDARQALYQLSCILSLQLGTVKKYLMCCFKVK